MKIGHYQVLMLDERDLRDPNTELEEIERRPDCCFRIPIKHFYSSAIVIYKGLVLKNRFMGTNDKFKYQIKEPE